MTVGAADGPVPDLLRRNRAWAERKTTSDPGFFARLVGQQRPRYFWIGCADSRVPATEIVDLDPGEMFVHRNVANLAEPGDPNFTAALAYAVDALGIDNILLVGHYGCGGIEAVLTEPADAVAQWLAPVRRLYGQHHDDLAGCSRGTKLDRLCELNVIEQVQALSQHPIVTEAWRSGRELALYGLVYGVGDGLLGHVCTALNPGGAAPHIEIQRSYQFARQSVPMS